MAKQGPARLPYGRIALASVLTLVLAGWASAQVQVAQSVTDLGVLRSPQQLTHRFEIVNAGTGTVDLVEVRTANGCLAPRVEPRCLAPGDKGVVTVAVNTLGQAEGPHTWTATLHYRQGDRPGEAPLELRARLTTDVTVQPAALNLFTEGVARQEVRIIDLRAQPLTIRTVQTSTPLVHARVIGSETDAQGHRVVRILVESDAAAPPGQIEDVLHIF